MFNLGDKVIVDTLKVPYLDWKTIEEIHDKIGTITKTKIRIHGGNNDPLIEYTIVFGNTTIQTVYENALSFADPPKLTLPEIQALKEQLALDLLQLIQTYEETTKTYIANVRLDIAALDVPPYEKCIGIRLEVHL